MRNDGRNCSRSLGQKQENNNIYRERDRERILIVYICSFVFDGTMENHQYDDPPLRSSYDA